MAIAAFTCILEIDPSLSSSCRLSDLPSDTVSLRKEEKRSLDIDRRRNESGTVPADLVRREKLNPVFRRDGEKFLNIVRRHRERRRVKRRYGPPDLADKMLEARRGDVNEHACRRVALVLEGVRNSTRPLHERARLRHDFLLAEQKGDFALKDEK